MVATACFLKVFRHGQQNYPASLSDTTGDSSGCCDTAIFVHAIRPILFDRSMVVCVVEDQSGCHDLSVSFTVSSRPTPYQRYAGTADSSKRQATANQRSSRERQPKPEGHTSGNAIPYQPRVAGVRCRSSASLQRNKALATQ